MNSIDTLRYITSQEFSKKIEDSLVKKVPLLSIAAFSALSLIPAIKPAAALAMRCIVLYTAVNASQNSECQSLYSLKTAAIGAGILGALTSSSAALVTSLALDIVFQAISFYEHEDKTKAAVAFGALAIEMITLSAICTGSVPLLISALMANALFASIPMLNEFSHVLNKDNTLEESLDHTLSGLCYLSLLMTGITHAASLLPKETIVTTYSKPDTRPVHHFGIIMRQEIQRQGLTAEEIPSNSEMATDSNVISSAEDLFKIKRQQETPGS